MNRDRWQRTTELFQAALERPPEEWEAYLQEACAGDLALQRAVKALLAADREAGDFLEIPLTRRVAD